MALLRKLGLTLFGATLGVGGSYGYMVFGPGVPMWFGPDPKANGWDPASHAVFDKLEADPDCARVPAVYSKRNFVWGGLNQERRVRNQFYFSDKKKELVGLVHFGPDTEGPPRCVHGGCTAAVVDSALGTCAWKSGHAAVTANLNVNYRKFIPLGSTVQVRSWVDRIEGRKVFMKYKVESLDGKTLHSEGSSLFITVKRLPNATGDINANSVSAYTGFESGSSEDDK